MKDNLKSHFYEILQPRQRVFLYFILIFELTELISHMGKNDFQMLKRYMEKLDADA